MEGIFHNGYVEVCRKAYKCRITAYKNDLGPIKNFYGP
jgi:hypothetical protein